MKRPRTIIPVALAGLGLIAVIVAGQAAAGPGTAVGAPLGPGEVTITHVDLKP